MDVKDLLNLTDADFKIAVAQRIIDLETEVCSLSTENQALKEDEVPVVYWLEDGAKLPERGKEGDIGYDAYINEDLTIEPHSAAKISLGIGMIIPVGFGVHARNRSGNFLGVKNYPSPINIGDAWVDNNYRGIVNALVQNVGDKAIDFKKGDRVCSIDLTKTYKINWKSIDDFSKESGISKEDLMNTNRGVSGFGSSGR